VQVEISVALDDDARILEQMLRVDWADTTGTTSIATSSKRPSASACPQTFPAQTATTRSACICGTCSAPEGGEAYEEWVGELMCTSTLRAVRAGDRSARKGVALGHTED